MSSFTCMSIGPEPRLSWFYTLVYFIHLYAHTQIKCTPRLCSTPVTRWTLYFVLTSSFLQLGIFWRVAHVTLWSSGPVHIATAFLFIFFLKERTEKLLSFPLPLAVAFKSWMENIYRLSKQYWLHYHTKVWDDFGISLFSKDTLVKLLSFKLESALTNQSNAGKTTA